MVNINTKKQLAKFFIYITGLPGSGKLSTAVTLSNMINAVIVNNHFYNNTQVCSIYNDAFQVSKEVQDRMYSIAQIMLQAIEAYPIDSKNYIFINESIKNNNHSIRMYNSIVELSKRMGTTILSVVLRCNSFVLQKRIGLKKLRKNRNVANMNSVRFREEDLFVPPGAIEIENSNISIKEVAEEIVSQVRRLSQIDNAYVEDSNFIY